MAHEPVCPATFSPRPRLNFALASWGFKLALGTLSLLFIAVYLRQSQAAYAQPGPVDCSMTQTGKVPLPDLGPELYCRDGNCFMGGLYPDGSAVRPPEIEQDALSLANLVQPLDAAGNPDAENGTIIMISVGMSNTSVAFDGPNAGGTEWTGFRTRAETDPATNPQLLLINGAQGGQAADAWEDPNGTPWQVVKDRIANASTRDELYTANQVQVVWVKQALRETGPFPDYAQELQGYLEAIARNLTIHFPNVKLAYFTSRTYAYILFNKGEPDTYEGGFSIRWMIEKQQSGDPSLNYDPQQGPVNAPLILWGPYYWTDGLTPRSDGLIWTCAEDGDMWDNPHPEPPGAQKNADQIYAFFKTDPTARPWYLRDTVIGQPPTVIASADVTSGPPPLTVHFNAAASDPDGTVVERVWTFGDGTFSYNPGGQPNSPPFYQNPNPVKTYYHPGTYPAYLTVTDDDGNAVTRTLFISVGGSGGPTPTPTIPPMTPSGRTPTPTATSTPAATPTPTSDRATRTPVPTATSTPAASATPTPTATASPPPPTPTPTATASQATAHVADLDGAVLLFDLKWRAQVTVLVHNGSHQAVGGAAVSGTWSGGTSGTGSCTTSSDGRCVITSPSMPLSTATATFTVGSVTKAGLQYQPAANHDPDGSSSGTTIVISKP